MLYGSVICQSVCECVSMLVCACVGDSVVVCKCVSVCMCVCGCVSVVVYACVSVCGIVCVCVCCSCSMYE